MQEELNSLLKPISDRLPQGIADYLNGGGWWIVLSVLALVLLLILLAVAGAIYRLLFRRQRLVPPDPENRLREDLAAYPPPSGPAGPRRLLVEGMPARLRLVVLAPVGKEARIDPAATELLLEHVVRGLGEVVRHDRPQVRVWPAQLSNQGFSVTFQRLVKKPEPEGKRSRWTLVAGRNPPGRLPLLVGLALYTDQPTTLGRFNLEPDRWGDVLRVRARDG
jgi:hypothetical protein